MIYITGDVHGHFGRIKALCEHNKTTKDDVLIILGDVGINFNNVDVDRKKKQKLSKLPITIFSIHGNHEKRPNKIDTYCEISWRNGVVYQEKEYPNLLFAKDGEIYDFDGKSVIAIGRAYSVDKYYRIASGYTWFEDEQPSDEIKAYVEAQLEKRNWCVDIVLSHTCPFRYQPTEAFLQGIDQSTVDNSTEIWLDNIEEKLSYTKWYCGHFHTEKQIDKFEFMFENAHEF